MPATQRGEHDRYVGVWLTQAEYERVKRRMELGGFKKFAPYARQMLVHGELNVTQGAFDPRPLRDELSRIGNNLNQIARWANTERSLSAEEAHRAVELMHQVQRAINAAIKAGGR